MVAETGLEAENGYYVDLRRTFFQCGVIITLFYEVLLILYSAVYVSKQRPLHAP